MATESATAESRIEHVHVLPDDQVIIAGGGPVGMVTAIVLAFHGAKSIVFERNMTTTKWPKMDLTNARSMELFRKLEIAEGLRARGVPPHIPYTVLMSTGLSQDTAVTQWDHPAVNEYQRTILSKNDGSQPLEPYQRISQEVFEAWMKEFCEANPLIDLRFGWKVKSIKETAEEVEAYITEESTGEEHIFRSKYAAGCDGASSITRRSLGILLDGGPVPDSFLLVHFRSGDLAKLHKQGRFWHLFMMKGHTFGGAVISQDEKDIFTIHLPLPPGANESTITSEEAVYKVLGGRHEPYQIKIDEILVRSTYQPSISVARRFTGPELRVFLAGDAAHQNIPTGGYGMNTGLGDAYDIGWKLAAMIKGYGRRGLLRSYEQERRPVSITNVERSRAHMEVHMTAVEMLGSNAVEIDDHSEDGSKLREAIHQHYQNNDGENTDLGIEMGYRYVSPICISNATEAEPPWNPHTYIPTTWPGSRPPHVFLKDGTAIFDHLGKEFSLVEFHQGPRVERGSAFIVEAAKVLNVELAHVQFSDEDHAQSLWQRPLVLIRPDGHVCWRGTVVEYRSQAYKIVETVVGYHDT